MRMVVIAVMTLLFASFGIYPAAAQDKATPSVQSPTTETVGRDWKAKPSDEQQRVGNATGKSPDSANHDDTNKVERDWRVEPGSQKNR